MCRAVNRALKKAVEEARPGILEEGKQEGKNTLLRITIHMLASKFGSVSDELNQMVSAQTLENLENMSYHLSDFQNEKDVIQFLAS